jgi:hypothetical protein
MEKANSDGARVSKDEALATLREHKGELLQRFGVVELALFGSTARDESTPESDIDILVTFRRPLRSKQYFGAVHYLEDLFEQPVHCQTNYELRIELRDAVEAESIRV